MLDSMGSRVLQRLFQSGKLLPNCFNNPKRNTLTYSQFRQVKQFSTTTQLKTNDDGSEKKSGSDNLPEATKSKHKVFEDEDSEIIFDVTEEQQRIKLHELNNYNVRHDPYEGINLERGMNGVFDIEDLVKVLKKDNAKHIFVAKVPPEYTYVDYIVIVTAKSQKHMQALATYVRKAYKLKRHTTDILPKLEGEKSKDWIAVDLGNIALHIFSQTARSYYDLETLWSVGPEYDDKTHEPADISIIDQYNAFLADLEPAEANDREHN